MQQPRTRTHRRSRLWSDLTALIVLGSLMLGALGASGLTMYQQFYGPSAFVTRYIELLSNGRAADALRVPGVAIDRVTLEAAGIDVTASEALLRQAALAPLTNVEVVSETTDGAITTVTVDYSAGQHKGTSSFTVEQDGWAGVTPNWRFTKSPLAAVELVVRGADQFAVNGFEIDRRQISAESDPLAPIPLLVFTPGLYSVTVDTQISSSPGISVLADSPLATTPVNLQTEPTSEFVSVVQQRVEEFLTQCTTQQVLQPTACPFGLQVSNRIANLPEWSITMQPTVTVEADGDQWKIPTTGALAHIEVDIRSLFDGSIQHVSEDVEFEVNGTISVLADGSVSIRVGSPADG